MAVFLCAGLALGLSAGEINLPLNAKIGKTLEGKVLQEVLQKVANSKKGVVEKNISEWDAIRNAYNGTFQGDNTGGPRTATNSAGMWIYATSYRDFANRVIFSRNYSKNGVKDYFHAVINADGTLQITSAITDYSTDRVYTTKPYPLNEWVYIQAFQQANLYTIGWKTATDEERKSRTFTRNVDLVGVNFENIFKIDNAEISLNSCVPVKEFFWQPGIYMFELMYNYNAKAKLIQQNRQNVFGLDSELVHNTNAVIMGPPSFFAEDSFIVYADSNDIVIDIRSTIGL